MMNLSKVQHIFRKIYIKGVISLETGVCLNNMLVHHFYRDIPFVSFTSDLDGVFFIFCGRNKDVAFGYLTKNV